MSPTAAAARPVTLVGCPLVIAATEASKRATIATRMSSSGPRPLVGRTAGGPDLPAMTGRAHSRCGVHRDADISGLGERRAAGVDTDADADLAVVGPGARLQPALDRDRRGQRLSRSAERGEEFIGPGIHLVAVR